MSIDTIIAIDGPAASGKSTLGQRLAVELGYLYFDTGIMYRAVTLAALNSGTVMSDAEACSQVARTVQIDVAPPSKDDGRSNDVLLDGVDQTWALRTSEVEAYVSAVAAYAGVRKALTEQQRRIGLRGQVVMVGRDIGTVVVPEAGLKIYLDASAEERARRRHLECVARGEDISYDTILAGVRQRDKIDSERDVAPLRIAEDARVINSDGLDAAQVVAQAMALVKEQLG